MDRFHEGVLNSNHLRQLQEKKVIRRDVDIDAKGSALDLHLGSVGWSLEGSIKQIEREPNETVEAVCGQYGTPFDLAAGPRVIEKGKVAVIKLEEQIDFSQHPWFLGEATGKSSIGRLDVLTRLLVDGCPEYERVPYGYKGPLYIEIAPISFGILLAKGLSLNQLRVHCGPRLPLTALIGRRLLFKSDDGGEFCATAQANSTLSLDISSREENGSKLAAYRLRDGQLPVLDLREKSKANAKDYFERIEVDNGALTIGVNRFYILRSVERLCLPEDIAVTGMAYSENLGELRIHYAGFAHPWFGAAREDGKTGTPLIFEVRAHNFPIVLRHEEVFATIRFYRMAEPIPEDDKEQEVNDYTNQELKLSNYFAPEPAP
jgi:dCTP deaminase